MIVAEPHHQKSDPKRPLAINVGLFVEFSRYFVGELFDRNIVVELYLMFCILHSHVLADNSCIACHTGYGNADSVAYLKDLFLITGEFGRIFYF